MYTVALVLFTLNLKRKKQIRRKNILYFGSNSNLKSIICLVGNKSYVGMCRQKI